jgi:hypothetical protein
VLRLEVEPRVQVGRAEEPDLAAGDVEILVEHRVPAALGIHGAVDAIDLLRLADPHVAGQLDVRLARAQPEILADRRGAGPRP